MCPVPTWNGVGAAEEELGALPSLPAYWLSLVSSARKQQQKHQEPSDTFSMLPTLFLSLRNRDAASTQLLAQRLHSNYTFTRFSASEYGGRERHPKKKAPWCKHAPCGLSSFTKVAPGAQTSEENRLGMSLTVFSSLNSLGVQGRIVRDDFVFRRQHVLPVQPQ